MDYKHDGFLSMRVWKKIKKNDEGKRKCKITRKN